jgi:hypothetical protein
VRKNAAAVPPICVRARLFIKDFALAKETRYDVTRLDILEAFGFAGPGVSGLIDH